MLVRISRKPRFKDIIRSTVSEALSTLNLNATIPQHTSMETDRDRNQRSVQPSVHTSLEETKNPSQPKPNPNQHPASLSVDSILLQSMEEACSDYLNRTPAQAAELSLTNQKKVDVRSIKDSMTLKFFASSKYKDVREVLTAIASFDNEAKFLIAFIYSISVVLADKAPDCMIIELKLTAPTTAEFGRMLSSKRQLQRLVFVGSQKTWHLTMQSFRGKKEIVEPANNPNSGPPKTAPNQPSKGDSQPKKQKKNKNKPGFDKAQSQPAYYQSTHGPGCQCPECYAEAYYGGYWDPQYYGYVGNKSGAGPAKQ